MKKLLTKIFQRKYKPKEFWDGWASDFIKDSWQVKIHPQHKWLLSIVKKQNPKSILEIGCGFGRNIKFLIENGVLPSRITGLDISAKMINLAREYIKNEKVKLYSSSLADFKAKKKFDLVFTHGVLMHTPNDKIEDAISKLIDLSYKHLILIEQNYPANNNYTFVHNYRNLLSSRKIDIIEYRSDKKLGLDLIYARRGRAPLGRSLKYGKNIVFNPEKLDPLNIDRQSTDLVPEGANVLDIGCATGFMGEFLKKRKKCRVVGVESGKDEVQEAKKVLDRVIIGDIEDEDTLSQIKEKFDVILASAIIEHLKNPATAIRSWKRFLKINGKLIVTTSNIAHWSQRVEFLRGKFEYKDYGILDSTHLRFYTTNTFPQLVRSAGYKIEKFAIDPVGGGYPRISKFLANFFPNLFAYQLLIKAIPDRRR